MNGYRRTVATVVACLSGVALTVIGVASFGSDRRFDLEDWLLFAVPLGLLSFSLSLLLDKSPWPDIFRALGRFASPPPPEKEDE